MASRVPTFCAGPDWFDVRDVGDGIHLINEPGHVASYLVLGEHTALLFDSGLGIAPISEAVRALTALPLLVVSSHHHVDHRGGNADLAAHADVVDFAAHPAATDPASGCLHGPADPAFLRSYGTAMTRVIEEYERFARLDEQYFFTLARLGRPRPLPDLTRWEVAPVPIGRTLDDGEVVDLGGRRFEVLHTPGHAPDTLCLFERASGILLAGDTVLAAAHWLHGPGADPAGFAASTRRLAELPITRILAAHNLVCELPARAAAEVARAAAALLAGATTARPGSDMLGQPVTRHDVGPVTLLTPSLG
ncbi:MBL fold metallo-hydrolase [Nocardia mexicana]|uniref:Glyoxylase-like metal-dependent hydrolase (Beta-lactamase superfamily II) n=1 Tax=Nocardia mexicana TaxID=279262 RepID=A0A370HG85_9NOCA|nr:MBL fold metallo-hydrolase [Nocardia mexicana]RDI56015.1 glyoxylase-like metal-dependent hydrolase (beta-lactamase superfamily II) [Nocardia mexicana]